MPAGGPARGPVGQRGQERLARWRAAAHPDRGRPARGLREGAAPGRPQRRLPQAPGADRGRRRCGRPRGRRPDGAVHRGVGGLPAAGAGATRRQRGPRPAQLPDLLHAAPLRAPPATAFAQPSRHRHVPSLRRSRARCNCWVLAVQAAHTGHREVVRVLLAAGADTTAENRRKKTALQLAKSRKHTEIVRGIPDPSSPCAPAPASVSACASASASASASDAGDTFLLYPVEKQLA